MPERTSPLASPIELAGRTLPNRFALTATLTNYAREHRVTERWIRFLAERARGGTALLVSEIIAVDPEALAHPAIVTGYDTRNEEGFARAAHAVAREGGTLLGQLWHPGRQQLWRPTRSPQGISDEPDPLSWTVPHVMETDELAALVERFVATGERLARAGFAGVELHGAHGYLITQLLSPATNDRQDRYGGSLEGRCAFVLEVARGLRDRCGPEFIVGLKMPADEGVEGGIDPDEGERITGYLAACGCFDYLAYGQGNFSPSLENHVPDSHFPPGPFLHLHARMRRAAGGTPVMALGRIDTPELAERIVAEGTADLVGLCRALLADAAFPRKALTGRREEIRPAPYDNASWGEVHAGRPLAEACNPELAEPGEADWSPRPADAPARVVVIGAGPAGLEAAWVAAARGHRVTLAGSGREPGGGLRLEAALPGHEPLGRLVRHLASRCRRLGVRMLTGRTLDADEVSALEPETVILATGARLRRPPWIDPFRGVALDARSLARRWPGEMPGGRAALLFDHDHTAPVYTLACLLARTHDRVFLMTPRPAIAQAVNWCSAIGIHRRLRRAGVQVMTGREPTGASPSSVRWRDLFSGETGTLRGIDTCVWATPRRVDDALARPLGARLGRERIHLVGDCVAPRNLLVAIHEGRAAGLAA